MFMARRTVLALAMLSAAVCSGQFKPAPPSSGGGPPTGTASGDLSGTYPSPMVTKVNGTALGSPAALTQVAGSPSPGAAAAIIPGPCTFTTGGLDACPIGQTTPAVGSFTTIAGTLLPSVIWAADSNTVTGKVCVATSTGSATNTGCGATSGINSGFTCMIVHTYVSGSGSGAQFTATATCSSNNNYSATFFNGSSAYGSESYNLGSAYVGTLNAPLGVNSGPINLTGKVSAVTNLTTAGSYGVPFVAASPTRLTGQVASIAATNLQINGAIAPIGMYRISFNGAVTTAGTAGDTLTLNCNSTDDKGADVQSSSAFSMSAAIPSAAFGYSCLVYTTGTANITYSATLSSTAGAPAYSLSVYMEKLQ